MRRTTVIVLALAIPALLSAAGLVAAEAWRAAQPETALFAPPRARTLAEAIAQQDQHQAYRFFVAGQHPEQPIAVQHRILTGGEVVQMPPLVWAVAVRNAGAVQMLISLGARLDGPLERRTPCLAAAVGDEDLAAMLRRYGADPGAPCAPLPDGPAPLAAFVAPAR